MSSQIAPQLYAAEEYLALERASPYKSEFVDGEIYAMTGASRAHNLIGVNIARDLSAQLKGRPCETYVNDMRVKAAKARSYHYPDVVVVCGQPELEDGESDTLLNPTVLIEVLSPSTEAYDRGKKFANYRKISSLREYLLVSQDIARIELFRRQGELWILTETEGLDSSIALEAVGCTLSLREVYERVLDADTPTED